MKIKNVRTYFYQKKRAVHCVLICKLVLNENEYNSALEEALAGILPIDKDGDYKIKTDAVAICAQRDHFDYKKGQKIALRRANKNVFSFIKEAMEKYLKVIEKQLEPTIHDLETYTKAYDVEVKAIEKLTTE